MTKDAEMSGREGNKALYSTSHPVEERTYDKTAFEALYWKLRMPFINVKPREWRDFLASLPTEPSIGPLSIFSSIR